MQKNKIYLIDWYNFIYRLFYAVPPFTTKDWTPINTVFWLAKMILGWHLEDKPDYLVFILDYKWKNFREEIFEDYKWTRDKMPTELKAQEDIIFSLLDTFWIPKISIPWYEADDIIWTLATKLGENIENEVYILSWDKDLFQFINDNVKVYDTMKRKIYSRKDSFEKFWVYPEHVVDYLAICWDSSDNIPWIPWFWPKKAQELIWKYWSLEKIYENLDDITWKTKDTLIEKKELAFLSKKLASIVIDLDLPWFNLENHLFKDIKIMTDEVIEFFKKYEFKSLIPAWHKEEIKNFATLWIGIKKPQSKIEYDEIADKIVKSGKVAISTTWSSKFELNTITFYIWEKIAYNCSSDDPNLKPFLNKLLDMDITIISFELKDDIEKIISFIEWKESSQSNNSMQASLF